MKNQSPPSLDNDSWVSWFAQDNLQTTGWVGLDTCRSSETVQGFRSEFASCERKLGNVERNVIIILLIAKAAYFIQSNTFWHLQHAFACLICYQCKHAVTIVTTTGWHRLTASASNAFQFSSRHKKKQILSYLDRKTRPECLYFSSCHWLTRSRYKLPDILLI